MTGRTFPRRRRSTESPGRDIAAPKLAPTSHRSHPSGEGTPTPVTVHGIEGLRYSGQMNDTMESIVWVEGGLSITVWGEMQGPPTFTHSDELLEIAEGVRPPTGD